MCYSNRDIPAERQVTPNADECESQCERLHMSSRICQFFGLRTTTIRLLPGSVLTKGAATCIIASAGSTPRLQGLAN